MGKLRLRKDHEHVLMLKYGQKHNTTFQERIYKCIDPDCYFYMKAGDLIGKRAMCPTCITDYVLDRSKLMKKKPHCNKCTKSVKAKEDQRILKDITKGLEDVLGLE